MMGFDSDSATSGAERRPPLGLSIGVACQPSLAERRRTDIE
ncbi:hypothetical protein [Natronorubrum texcoconense]|nr:hypothetical protein [Natronorubrum texcoconense]